MTVHTANRSTSQHYSNTNVSAFPGEELDNVKHPIGQKFDPRQQKYSSTSSATQLKAKFGQGRKIDSNNSNKTATQNYSNSYTNLGMADNTDGVNNKANGKNGVMFHNKKNAILKEVKPSSVTFTPPTNRKGASIGLKWEMGRSQESSSSSLPSWMGTKNNFHSNISHSKSHSNIQDLAVDDGRGFVPSEVAKDPNQKEFLTNLSKRIFSNPGTKVIQEELQRRRTEQNNSDDRKRSLSAGRNIGPSKISSNSNGREGGRFQRTFKESQQQQSFASSSISNNPVLEKALAPANDADYDSNSLKRRNPRQMFTDSAFYSPKYHPSVADQVEMAHQLSSSLYNDGNKMSKGQEMYLKRAKTSGDTSDIEASLQQPGEKPLNMKLVMNPEGKLHDWTDLPEEEIPELQQIATGGMNTEAARQMVENLQACKGRGGELFAKRRKKADKWVVDEGSLRENPSQLADQFLVQQQDFKQQQYQERTEVNHTTSTTSEVVDSGAAEERQRLQEEFNQQQLLKQQQGFEMRQERQSNTLVPGGPADAEDLPPNFQHCSLKGRPFTPTMDLGIHNKQGIDVWTTKGPRPYGKSGTLPRTTIKQATKSGELPPQPSKQQQQAPPQAALAVPQVAICPATPAVTDQQELVVSSHQQSSSTVMASSSSVTTVQQGGAQTVQQSSVQEVATHTQISQNKDEVDRAKQAAEEQQRRLEQEKREMELREEQKRLEQMKQEQELKERQLREQQQREQELLEQQHREQQQREQQALEQQRKEQELREQQILEQQKREQEAREQQFREQQLREEQMREQQMLEQQKKEQEMREQQMREQQMREQQMKEQQMREQQMREQQMREQQMKEQQMREQQMREQQMREQQMQQQQQQQFQQQQMSMSRTTTETSSFSQQQSLHQSNLSMQVKSGGFLSGGDGQQRVEDYTSSLKPTSEGEIIRTHGDLQYSQSAVQQGQMEQVQLRKTSASKDNMDNIRQSGVFVGIAGDLNALVADGNEKHSVRDIVKHFSKVKPGDIPQQMMPQYYQSQHAPPSLSELQEQAKDRQFSYQKKDHVDGSSELSQAEQKAAEEKMKLFERRTSLKDFLLIEGEKSQHGNQLIDPSNILQVDGSVEGKKLYNGTRRSASGRELDSQGRLIDTDKWDNHNAIARGWKHVEDNYHPVTFRKIYGVEKQAPTPVPTRQPQIAATTPVTSQQTIPSEEPEGASDL